MPDGGGVFGPLLGTSSAMDVAHPEPELPARVDAAGIAEALVTEKAADDGGAAAIRAVVRTAIGAAAQAGTVSLSTVGDVLEPPGRALARRVPPGR